MEYKAIAKFLRYSPYKIRPLADNVRHKNASAALAWLSTYASRRVVPLKKVIESAVANAKQIDGKNAQALMIKEIMVDEGPMFRYFKPGAQGRAQVQRKRSCHIRVTLQDVQSL